jgi:WhiB family redox-sensing transcriptional regulator
MALKGTSVTTLKRTDESWQDKAACRGPQAVYFYPPLRGERREEKFNREAMAKSICETCKVRQECLEYAICNNEVHGIWGGLTEIERRRLSVVS